MLEDLEAKVYKKKQTSFPRTRIPLHQVAELADFTHAIIIHSHQCVSPFLRPQHSVERDAQGLVIGNFILSARRGESTPSKNVRFGLRCKRGRYQTSSVHSGWSESVYKHKVLVFRTSC